MNENKTGFIDTVRSRLENLYRSKILKIPSKTSLSYALSGGGRGREDLKTVEPSVEMRARSNGKDIALSFILPADRHTSFVLSLSSAAQDQKIKEVLEKNFSYPKNEFLLQVSKTDSGVLNVFISISGLEMESHENGTPVTAPLEKNSFHEISSEFQSSGRIILKGKNEARLSIRIHDNQPHNYTEREKYLVSHEPQIRRIHNEAWLNSNHIPSAYVEDDYDPSMDGTALQFLKKNDKGFESGKWKWAPFCPDRDKYWGIAARNPEESCETLKDVDVCIVVSDHAGIQHGRLTLDMPRTFLGKESIRYLKPEIEHRARKVSTEGQTGLIHLGDDVHDGWYYVTQPIPKLKEGLVDGYFVLIGRRATLTPEKEEALYSSLWKDKG